MSSSTEIPVGLAALDVTPSYPIRLSGYGARREETDRAETRLMAKALVMGDDPVMLLTVENCGVTETFTETVAERIRQKTGIRREGVALCYSHTHTGPFLTGAAPMLFNSDIAPEHQKAIDRYTAELMDRLVEVGLAAMENRSPGNLAFAEGYAGFAANRRQQTGPVDHVMPLIRITDAKGKLRALWSSYACHCTTLGPEDNYFCGDWVGYAQEALEHRHPGATALVTIGCAADANPFPRTGLAYAREHGEEIADEADHVLNGTMRPLSGPSERRLEYIDLPFDPLPSREELAARVAEGGRGAYHARKWLERLDRGERIPTDQPYPVQTWSFGDDLTIVFLASEVVADFVWRLRRIFDRRRLWVGAYANAFPGYIPSRRIWQEGGYEGADATIYFGMPTRYAEDVEDRVIETVQRLVPSRFRRP